MVKNPPVNAGNKRDLGSIPGLGKIPWRRAWQPTPESLPGESRGQRSLLGYKSWGCRRAGHDLATKQQHPPMNRAMVACLSAQPPAALLNFFLFNDLLQ